GILQAKPGTTVKLYDLERKLVSFYRVQGHKQFIFHSQVGRVSVARLSDFG
ncbi:hypothetical protein THIOM_001153, partial [Candidatus Thiomargarita nelsonii]